MKFLNNPKLVEYTPLVAVPLLESANISQLWQMWSEWTAAGQSILGWCLVNAALFLWWNYYRVNRLKWAYRATTVSILFNMLVIASAIYFRL